MPEALPFPGVADSFLQRGLGQTHRQGADADPASVKRQQRLMDALPRLAQQVVRGHPHLLVGKCMRGEARTPIFFSGGWICRPLASGGHDDQAERPRSASVLRAAQRNDQRGRRWELVIQALLPWMTHSSASAGHGWSHRPPGRMPAPGSVSARAPRPPLPAARSAASAVSEPPTRSRRWGRSPGHCARPSTSAVPPQAQPSSSMAMAALDSVHAGAAKLFRDVQPQQAERPHLGYRGGIEFRPGIQLRRLRSDLLQQKSCTACCHMRCSSVSSKSMVLLNGS